MFQHSPSSPNHDRMSSPMPGHAPTYTGLNNYAEITPGDSASVVHDDNHSTVSSHLNNTFSFKFNYGNKTHRFRHDISNFQGLLEVIQQKIMVEHLSISQSYVAVGKGEEGDANWLTIAYLDDENDQVLMTCDSDLADSVQLARKAGLDRVRLFVHDSLADAVAEQQLLKQQKEEEEQLKLQQQQASIHIEVPASQPTTLSYNIEQTSAAEDLSEIKEEDEEEEEQEEEEEIITKKKKSHSTSNNGKVKRDISAEYNLPVPQDMLLPAAITFLGVVILGVFTISKLTSGNSSGSRY
jgi:hypothetical protein